MKRASTGSGPSVLLPRQWWPLRLAGPVYFIHVSVVNTPHSTWQLLAFQTEHLESWGDVLFISCYSTQHHATRVCEEPSANACSMVEKRRGGNLHSSLPAFLPSCSLRVLRNPFYLILSRQWHPTPVLLPGKSHEWRSLVGCSPWGC